jgi:hypothetical protein
MISIEKFEKIKEKYGFVASWAIWAEVEDTPKSKVSDLTIFCNKEILKLLNPQVILVGLNISRDDIEKPLANFHSPLSKAQDYKLRFALKSTPMWGAYMTDIIKDFSEVNSGNLLKYLKENKEFEKENIKIFLKELDVLEAVNPLIVSMGSATYRILKRNLPKSRIIKIKHYSHFIGQNEYRKEILKTCSELEL